MTNCTAIAADFYNAPDREAWIVEKARLIARELEATFPGQRREDYGRIAKGMVFEMVERGVKEAKA